MKHEVICLLFQDLGHALTSGFILAGPGYERLGKVLRLKDAVLVRSHSIEAINFWPLISVFILAGSGNFFLIPYCLHRHGDFFTAWK